MSNHEPTCTNKSKPRTRIVEDGFYVSQWCEHCGANLGRATLAAIGKPAYGRVCAPLAEVIKPGGWLRP